MGDMSRGSYCPPYVMLGRHARALGWSRRAGELVIGERGSYRLVDDYAVDTERSAFVKVTLIDGPGLFPDVRDRVTLVSVLDQIAGLPATPDRVDLLTALRHFGGLAPR
jgi:hypothetical protein